MTQITDYDEFHIINEGLNYWLFALLVLFVLSIFAFSFFNVRIYICFLTRKFYLQKF